jgi:hypothetical protein
MRPTDWRWCTRRRHETRRLRRPRAALGRGLFDRRAAERDPELAPCATSLLHELLARAEGRPMTLVRAVAAVVALLGVLILVHELGTS